MLYIGYLLCITVTTITRRLKFKHLGPLIFHGPFDSFGQNDQQQSAAFEARSSATFQKQPNTSKNYFKKHGSFMNFFFFSGGCGMLLVSLKMFKPFKTTRSSAPKRGFEDFWLASMFVWSSFRRRSCKQWEFMAMGQNMSNSHLFEDGKATPLFFFECSPAGF